MASLPAEPRCGFVAWPGALLLAASLAFMGVAAWRYAPSPEAAFLSDGSPVAWLSSAQLWALGLLSLQLAAQRLLPPRLGLWLGSALLALAFDEQFLFHEQWKYGCASWLAACRWQAVQELPALLVAVLGGASVFALHRALPPPARRPLWLGFGTGLCALALDLGGRPAALLPWEEALEVLAEAGVAAALLGLRAPPARQAARVARGGLRCIRRRARCPAGASGRRG